MRKDKLIDFCNVWWPKYVLPDNRWWPENGSLEISLISQLMSYCEQEGKMDDIPYVDLFSYLRGKPEWLVECKIKMMVLENNRCLACVQDKRCAEHLVLKGGGDELDPDLMAGPPTNDSSALDSTPFGLTSPDSLTPSLRMPVQHAFPLPLPAQENPSPLPMSAQRDAPYPSVSAQGNFSSPHITAQSYPPPRRRLLKDVSPHRPLRTGTLPSHLRLHHQLLLPLPP